VMMPSPGISSGIPAGLPTYNPNLFPTKPPREDEKSIDAVVPAAAGMDQPDLSLVIPELSTGAKGLLNNYEQFLRHQAGLDFEAGYNITGRDDIYTMLVVNSGYEPRVVDYLLKQIEDKVNVTGGKEVAKFFPSDDDDAVNLNQILTALTQGDLDHEAGDVLLDLYYRSQGITDDTYIDALIIEQKRKWQTESTAYTDSIGLSSDEWVMQELDYIATQWGVFQGGQYPSSLFGTIFENVRGGEIDVEGKQIGPPSEADYQTYITEMVLNILRHQDGYEQFGDPKKLGITLQGETIAGNIFSGGYFTGGNRPTSFDALNRAYNPGSMGHNLGGMDMSTFFGQGLPATTASGPTFQRQQMGLDPTGRQQLFNQWAFGPEPATAYNPAFRANVRSQFDPMQTQFLLEQFGGQAQASPATPTTFGDFLRHPTTAASPTRWGTGAGEWGTNIQNLAKLYETSGQSGLTGRQLDVQAAMNEDAMAAQMLGGAARGMTHPLLRQYAESRINQQLAALQASAQEMGIPLFQRFLQSPGATNMFGTSGLTNGEPAPVIGAPSLYGA